jgi:hypothetical protein
MYTFIHIYKYHPNWFINFVWNNKIIIIKEKIWQGNMRTKKKGSKSKQKTTFESAKCTMGTLRGENTKQT